MEELITENISYRLRRIGAPATVKDVADVFALKQNTTVIGRAKNNVDLFMDSSKNKALISRIHARISKSETANGGDVFKIHDVSLNGTYVNDVKISSEALLRPGDVVTFGHLQGACLESGNCYKQLNSEFKFLFESFHGEVESNLTNINNKTDSTQNKETILPKFSETPTTSAGLSVNCTRQRVLTFENSDESYYQMLQEYASTAVASFTKQGESDDDLLPVKYTQILSSSEEKNKSTKSPEKKRRRSNQKLQSINDTCSASKCIRPKNRVVSWVQCDDCDQWYHIKCCGLSLKLVKVKNSKFHCGCS